MIILVSCNSINRNQEPTNKNKEELESSITSNIESRFDSFDEFEMKGISYDNLINNTDGYVVSKYQDDTMILNFYNLEMELEFKEYYTIIEGYYYQNKEYYDSDEGVSKIKTTRCGKNEIISIVLIKEKDSYYLDEIKKETKTGDTIFYVSQYFDSEFEISFETDLMNDFQNVYNDYHNMKSYTLWEYTYTYSEDACKLKREHKELNEKGEYETYFSEIDCYYGTIATYFWFMKNYQSKSRPCE